MVVIAVTIPDAIASFVAVASDATSVVVHAESTAGMPLSDSSSLPSSFFFCCDLLEPSGLLLPS